MTRERIGILGGTFNPIHQGHAQMAKAAMETARLDRVLVLPDGAPPHKAGIAPAEHRWRMVCAAVSGAAGLEPCRMELDREGTTYTFDTLTRLHEQFPKAELYYLIGTDTLMQLHTWHRAEEVLRLCTFLLCPRHTEISPKDINAERKRLTSLGATFQDVRMEVVNVSSTQVRAALESGAPTPLLAPTVQEYCGAAALYGLPARLPSASSWLERLFADLTVKRFAHTLGVAYTARTLAKNHGVDVRKAETAALLHDCAKCMPLKDMQAVCRRHALTEDAEVLGSGALLHSLVGSCLAAEVYGVEDPDILRAIACHTTGKVGMTKLDMVVYLADKVEPGREAYPLLNKVRMMAPLSLERAMLASMEGTAEHVKSGGKHIHPQTLETIAWLKTLPANAGSAGAQAT